MLTTAAIWMKGHPRRFCSHWWESRPRKFFFFFCSLQKTATVHGASGALLGKLVGSGGWRGPSIAAPGSMMTMPWPVARRITYCRAIGFLCVPYAIATAFILAPTLQLLFFSLQVSKLVGMKITHFVAWRHMDCGQPQQWLFFFLSCHHKTEKWAITAELASLSRAK